VIDRLIDQVKDDSKEGLEMKYLGIFHYYLEVCVQQQHHKIFIAHHKFAIEVLMWFKMEDCKVVVIPMV
jgi:hypothetical protein